MRVRLKHDRLARALARRGLSQNRWAQKLGLSSGHLSMLVNGERLYPSARTRRKLMEGLGLDFDDLFIVETAPVATRVGGLERRIAEPAERGSLTMLASLFMDFSQAVRQLSRRSPLFTVAAILTLALGIGPVTTIFSVVHHVLLRPLPYQDAENILTLWQDDRAAGVPREKVAPANFVDWRERSTVFERIAAVQPFGYDFMGADEPRELAASRVSEGFFEILATPPLMGRVFTPEEYAAGGPNVAVISHQTWVEVFGADPALLRDRTVTLDGEAWQVVGVMPPDFRFPRESRLWTPRPDNPGDLRARRSTYLEVVARPRAGVDRATVETEMGRLAAQLADEYPQANASMGVTIVPMDELIRGEIRPALLIFSAAVAMVLLIACCNVAGLLLARASQKRREFGIRLALGAPRLRLLGQALAEAFVLGAAGAVVGVAMAWWALGLLAGLGPAGIPQLGEVRLDTPVLLFAGLVSILSALFFGLLPSLEATRTDPLRSLSVSSVRSSQSAGQSRLRQSLVVGQVAVATVLLVGAGLLLRSFLELTSVDPGFEKDRLAAVQIFPNLGPDQTLSFYSTVLERLRALPQVERAGGVLSLPFGSDINIDPGFSIQGQPKPPPGQEPVTSLNVATSDYFPTMGIPLLRGRLFEPSEDLSARPVAIINQTMAERFWPDGDPIGDRLDLNYRDGVTVEVIGVVGDSRQVGLDVGSRPELYVPYGFGPSWAISFVVRSARPEALIPLIKQEIWGAGYQRPLDLVATLDMLVDSSTRQQRFNAWLLGSFAFIALGLSAVGLYGLIAFSVAGRTHELGVRMALAARPVDILRLVLREGLGMALVGVALGGLASLAMVRSLESLLFGVSAYDPWTFVATAGFLIAVATAASLVPARRAMRLDPADVLRAG